MNKYNERIKRYMREQKRSQQNIADLLGMKQPSVYARLNSDKTFEIEDLIKLCGYFGVSISEFLYEGMEENKKPPAQILSPDDLLMIFNKRHDEVMNRLSEIIRLLSKN